MIVISGLELRRGGRKLLENVNFTVHPGWKVGVAGRNGTGKSSLFSLLLKELAPDAGDLQRPKDWTIATVAQNTPALEQATIEFVLDGDAELRAVQLSLATAEASHDAAQIAALHDHLNAIGGYSAKPRAAKLLNGLGFLAADETRNVAEFSGGWRMRLNLARALMIRSDLLLLDEPTNHLDLDTVVWLQSWLQSYAGTLLVISHDREFLDAVTRHTVHLENSNAILYTGNYSQFERQRAERLSQQASSYQAQQIRIGQLQSFVDRFRAKASKAKQAQARLKMIERMSLLAPAQLDSPFDFEFLPLAPLPDPMLNLKGVRISYGERVVLSTINLSLRPGDRIGLLGANGAGKSTLIKAFSGKLEPSSGEAHRSPGLKVGYFAQHQIDQLDLAASPILHLQRIDKKATEQELRNYLGGFNFRGERVFEAVSPFSGGEKARLALALLIYTAPNLLLLDEPTNHLDLEMCQALENALQLYAGPLVLVSHDRHLLQSCCDTFWLVGNQRVEEYTGDLDDYARLITQNNQSSDELTDNNRRPSAKDQRKLAADQRQKEKPLRDEMKKLDKKLDDLKKQLMDIEVQLAKPEIYGNGSNIKLTELLKTQGALHVSVADTEERWLAIAEVLESEHAA